MSDSDDSDFTCDSYISKRFHRFKGERECLFCRKPMENQFTPVNGNKDVLGALDLLKIEYETLPDMIDYICYQCVYMVYVILDFRRFLARNIKKSRANHFYNIGNKEMCRKFLQASRIDVKPFKDNKDPVVLRVIQNIPLSNAYSSKSSNKRSNLNTNIASPLAGHVPISTNETTIAKKRNIPSASSRNSGRNTPESNNTSARNVLKETNSGNLSIDTLANEINLTDTESTTNPPGVLLNVLREFSENARDTESGGHVNYALSNDKNKTDTQLQCRFCERKYKRLRFLRRHEMAHRGHVLRGRSRFGSTSTVTLGTSKSSNLSCYECNLDFTSLAEMRGHELFHKNSQMCKFCGKEFHSQHVLQFHEAECYGKNCGAISDEEVPEIQSNRYRTRSAARRRRNFEVVYGNDCERTSLRMSHAITDDEVSVADSLHSIRQRNVQNWVGAIDLDDVMSVTSCISSRSSSLSRASFTPIDFDDSVSMREIKPYQQSKSSKTIVHGKIKRRVNNDNRVKLCPERGCPFSSSSFDALMLHDISEHNLPLLFYCKQCKKRFARKIYLDRHLKYQLIGEYKCHKCEEIFIYHYELMDHLWEHKENLDYKCDVCNLSFITEHELCKHLLSPTHNETREYLMNPVIFERQQYNDMSTKNILERLNDNSENGQQREIESQGQGEDSVSIKSENIEDSNDNYESVVKILTLMETERPLDKYEFDRWEIGSVVRKLSDGTENCVSSRKVIFQN